MSQDHKATENDAPRTPNETNLKTVLKFDTGADGFQMMIYVLIISAISLLGFGIYFLISTFGHRSV